MSPYYRHHLILKALAEHYFEWEKTKKGIVAIDFETFKKRFDCTKAELEIMTARLFSQGEIMYYNVGGIEGISIKPEGISSFAQKKYLKERESYYFDKAKNWVQLLIPLTSLVLATAIFLRSNSTLTIQDKELQALKEQVRKLQIFQQSTLSNERLSKDSLSLK